MRAAMLMTIMIIPPTVISLGRHGHVCSLHCNYAQKKLFGLLHTTESREQTTVFQSERLVGLPMYECTKLCMYE